MDFKLFLSNSIESKKQILSLLILFTNLPNIQKLNQFIIISTILQKPTPILTQLKQKQTRF